MPKISMFVPDGDSCKDCPFLSDFFVSETECTTTCDEYPKYIRKLEAKCRLFNLEVYGDRVTEMHKCYICAEHK